MLLHTNDLERSRRFYQGVLGFAVLGEGDQTLTVELEGARVIFTHQNLWPGTTGCAGTLYFTVRDVDGYFETVKDTGLVSWPLQQMPYGSHEFGLIDCNGYHLGFHQDAREGGASLSPDAARRRVGT